MSVHTRLLLLLLLFTTGLCAQVDVWPNHEVPLTDSLFATHQEKVLQHSGFPDASCQKLGDTIWLAYTRSRFRPGASSTKAILNTMAPFDSGAVRVAYITVCDRSLPVYTYSIPVTYGAPELDRAQFDILPSMSPLEERSHSRILGDDYTGLFSLDPQFRFSFGASPDPVQVQFNLLPRVDLRLWKGSLLRLQYIIPVWNELDIPEEDFWRPGLITFSQYIRLGKGFLSNFTAGYFSPYRYGVQAQLCKFFFKDRMFFGTQFGYTGYASYPVRLYVDRPVAGWQISDIEYLDYMLMAGWRWNRYNLQLVAGWGKGLYDQEVKTLSISRQFNLTTVEFFTQQLNRDWNYGMRLQIPFPFIRKIVGKRLIIQTSPFVDFYYNGTQNYFSEYWSGQRLPFFTDHLHPDLIY